MLDTALCLALFSAGSVIRVKDKQENKWKFSPLSKKNCSIRNLQTEKKKGNSQAILETTQIMPGFNRIHIMISHHTNRYFKKVINYYEI